MEPQTPANLHRQEIAKKGGLPTRESSSTPGKTINVRELKKGGQVADRLVIVDAAFLNQLQKNSKTAADVDALQLNGLALEELRVLIPSGENNKVEYRGATFTTRGLSGVLTGTSGAYDRFTVREYDQKAGGESEWYNLPVVDIKTGRVILIRATPEDKGRLQNICLENLSDRKTSGRISTPEKIKTTSLTKNVEGLDVPVEHSSGVLTLGNRGVRVEAASTVGLREGDDEDFVYLNRFNLPYVGDVLIASVKDGIGGHSAGEVASETAAEAENRFLIDLQDPNSPEWQKIQTLAKNKHNGDMRSALAECAVLKQNEAVLAKKKPDNNLGSTTVEAFIFSDKIYTAHVGDSRAYLARDGKSFYRITGDHSLVESLRAKGSLSAEDAMNNDQRNVIFRSLGDKPNLDVTIGVWNTPKEPGAKVVLCCDGWWEAKQDHSDPTGHGAELKPTHSPQASQDFSGNLDLGNEVVAAMTSGKTNGNIDNISIIAVTLD